MEKRLHTELGLMLLVLGLSGVAGWAQLVDLNFDDISATPGPVAMPPGYGGVSWPANVGVWGGAQDPYNPSSPPNRVLFNYGGQFGVAETRVTFLNGAEVFDGAYFSGSGSVNFRLYSGATLVATSGALTASNVATFLPAGYSGPVTSVGIVGNEAFLAMDDFIYGVPEPGPAGLAGAGLLALALCRGQASRRLVRPYNRLRKA